MNKKLAAIWERLQAYEFDAMDSELPFSARLARENHWTAEYTAQAIEEYKKFILLCCHPKKSATPSDAVDQVWHLHLTYTRSYWEDFCKNVLRRRLHHQPTKGGASERTKYHELYAETLARYERIFGEKPPYQLWPSPQQRFSDLNFARLNLDKVFIFNKSKIKKHLFFAAFIALLVGLRTAPAVMLFLGGIAAFFLYVFPAAVTVGAASDSGCGSGGCGGGFSSGDAGCSSGDSGGCSSGCGGGCGGCS